MQSGVEKKYIILFAILIAITGFTLESQIGNNPNAQASAHTPAQNFYPQAKAITVNHP